MIRYSLLCEAGHDFESWFPSSGAFDEQRARGFVACPFCGSQEVSKAIMAPSVSTRDAGKPATEAPPAPLPAVPTSPALPGRDAPQPVTLMSDKEKAFRSMLRAVREHVTRTADYVGPGFAAEARRMHYGEVEHRSIYGEAAPDEARALLEEGIEVHALPIAPDDRN